MGGKNLEFLVYCYKEEKVFFSLFPLVSRLSLSLSCGGMLFLLLLLLLLFFLLI